MSNFRIIFIDYKQHHVTWTGLFASDETIYAGYHYTNRGGTFINAIEPIEIVYLLTT